MDHLAFIMGKKAKTRIVVQTPRGIQELFSVLEQRDSGLQIFLKHELKHEDQRYGDVKIDREKFSVHPSHQSQGTTIQRSNPLEDGRFLTTSAFVEQSKSGLLFPLYGRRVPKLEPARYASNIRPSDTVVTLTQYDDSKATLLYSVFVSSLDLTPPEYPDKAGNAVSVEFSNYRITIYFAFIALPSIGASDYAFFATSPQQEIRNPVKPFEGGALSLTETEAYFAIDHIADGLWRSLYERVGAAIDDPTEHSLREFSKICRMVLVRPFEDLERSANKLPIIFTSSLPLCDGARGVIISCEGKTCGKIFLD